MASPAATPAEPIWETRERPWLVSWNRRLRHLHSLAVRNLTLSQSDRRSRAKIADDDAVPNTLRSPAKLLALREARTIGHSKSSDDLRPLKESLGPDRQASKQQPNGLQQVSVVDTKARRPNGFRLRRRSTIDWASATPQRRQKRMEDVSAARLADVFFSLHVQGVEDPIYVSETVYKTMNPTFQHTSLEECGGPGVARLDTVTVKLWVRTTAQKKFHVLLEMTLNLRSLQFIGKDLASFIHPFPPNSIIFELSDGFYTCFTNAQVDEPSNPFVVTRSKISSPRTLRTTSFDALLRLSKLDDSIQDAFALREKLSHDLSTLVESSRQPLIDKDHLNESMDYFKTVEYAKAAVDKQLKTLRHTRDEKRYTLARRRELLSCGRSEITTGATEMVSTEDEMSEVRTDLSLLRRSISNQRRRISSDLGTIFPIAAIPDKPLSFTIRGLHLPDSESLDSSPPDQLSAALGHVAHALQLLSFYLRHPIPYPTHPRSSTTIMTDPISNLRPPKSGTSTASPYPTTVPRSLSDPTRSFPLYARSSGPRYRFDYALFLLNKDLHVLLSDAFGVRVLDIRQTLPNLMYVLACMAAGEGELPARKAGGVRGLLRNSVSQVPDQDESKFGPISPGMATSFIRGHFGGDVEERLGPKYINAHRKPRK